MRTSRCVNESGVTLEEWSDLSTLAELEPAWSALWDQSPLNTPFQAPAWVLPWLRQFGRGAEFRVLALRLGGSLAAVLPLFRQRGETTFCIPGAGISDYLGGCFSAKHPVAARLLFQQIARGWPHGTRLDLQQLQAESPLLNALAPEFEATLEPQDCCPILDLPDGVEPFLNQLAPTFRKDLAYAQRRLQKAFSVQFFTATPHTVDSLLDCFYALHAKRWNGRSEAGALADPGVREFHRTVARNFADAGHLRLHLLALNGEPASAFYGFQCGTTTFFYLSGFDPKFAAYSVGNVVLDHSIRNAIAEGCFQFNFLRGREAYKYRWGAKDSLSYRRILVTGRTLRADCLQ